MLQLAHASALECSSLHFAKCALEPIFLERNGHGRPCAPGQLPRKCRYLHGFGSRTAFCVQMLARAAACECCGTRVTLGGIWAHFLTPAKPVISISYKGPPLRRVRNDTVAFIGFGEGPFYRRFRGASSEPICPTEAEKCAAGAEIPPRVPHQPRPALASA